MTLHADITFHRDGVRARVVVGPALAPGLPDPDEAAAAARAWARRRRAPLALRRRQRAVRAERRPAHRRARLAAAARRGRRAGLWAAERTGGLVDPTLSASSSAAGYASSRARRDAGAARRGARGRSAARSGRRTRRAAGARSRVDDAAGTIARPPGVRIDTGGTGKGLAADAVARRLARLRALRRRLRRRHRVGGPARRATPLSRSRSRTRSPATIVHDLALGGGGVATSGLDVRDLARRRRRLRPPPARSRDRRAGVDRCDRRDRARADRARGRDAREGGAPVRPASARARCSPITAASSSTTTARSSIGRRRAPRVARLPRPRAARDGRPRSTRCTYGWWLASRASGVVALVARVALGRCSASTMAGKLLRRPGRRARAAPRCTSSSRSRPRRDRRPRPHAAGRPLAASGRRRDRGPVPMAYRPGRDRAGDPRRLPRGAARPELLRAPADRRAPWRKAHRLDDRCLAARRRPRPRRRHRRDDAWLRRRARVERPDRRGCSRPASRAAAPGPARTRAEAARRARADRTRGQRGMRRLESSSSAAAWRPSAAPKRCARSGHDGALRIVCGEPHAPYDRPPLSKELLAASARRDTLRFRPDAWYAERDVELLLGGRGGRRSTRPRAGCALGGRRRPCAYDRLVIATGAAARRLPAFDGLPTTPRPTRPRRRDRAVATACAPGRAWRSSALASSDSRSRRPRGGSASR